MRHGDQVATALGQAADLGRRRTVVDARIRRGLGDLLGRQVRGMDVAEVFRQCPRGLAVAGAAIPGQVCLRALPRQPDEEFRGIGGAGLGVTRSVAGKMVRGQSLRPFR